ncbi:MAG: hypothetical protein LC753_17045 [Acidobacteria bacterium]|nr:hypothetical protein [Acidobacteriota bacterium]
MEKLVQPPRRALEPRGSRLHVTGVQTTAFPDWVEPMAATLTQERFTGPEWIFERKLDGIRLLAFKQGADVRLLSRNRLPQHIPSLVQAIAALPVGDLILDGEVTWDGRTAYHVFDILWLDGRDVMSVPLDARRALLRELPLRAPLQRVPSLDDSKPWERACNEGWEIGTGFDTKLLLELRARLDAIEILEPPFTRAVGLPRLRAHWARPEIVVQVGFIEWTVHGKLRHPRLLGVRTDKVPREVVREAPAPRG